MTDNKIFDIILTVIALFTLIVIIYSVGYLSGKHKLRTEAVNNGYAHWNVDTNGITTFEWSNINTNK